MWLMLQAEIDRVEALRSKLTAEIEAELAISAEKEPDPLDIVDGIALIKIEGILTPKRIRWLDYFGEKQAVYPEIQSRVREAESMGASKIQYYMDTPGGDVTGLYDTMMAIKGSPLPSETKTGEVLASGGYMLASQTGKITARHVMSLIGSIGVATSRLNLEAIKEIANTDSPKKKPDVSTKKGVKVVQEELDDIYQVLAEQIAIGRNTSVETVKKDYGQGAVMTARTAFARNMIDAIEIKQPASKPAAKKERNSMNREELKAEHPAVFTEVFEAGKDAAKEEIVDCLGQHAILAKDSGDYESAIAEMATVTAVTGTIRERHYSKARNRNLIAAAAADNPPDVGAGEAGAGGENGADWATGYKLEFEAECPGLEVEVL